MTVRLLWASLLVLAPAVAAAQTDIDGAKDHPVVPRLAGGQYYISDYEARDFGAAEYSIKDAEKTVEGRYTRIEYWIKEGAKAFSGIEIGRNYQKAIAEKKGETLHFDLSNSGGSATFRFAVEGRVIWVGLDISNGGEVYELEIVEETVMNRSVEINAGAMAAARKMGLVFYIPAILYF